MSKRTVQNFSSLDEKTSLEKTQHPLADLFFNDIKSRSKSKSDSKMSKTRHTMKIDKTKILSHYGHPVQNSNKSKSLAHIQHPDSMFWADNSKFGKDRIKSDKNTIASNNTKSPASKYAMPKTKNQKKQDKHRRKKYVESLNFCKHEVLDVVNNIKKETFQIELQVPSCEITEAKVFPRTTSTALSDIYPEPPSKSYLSSKKPKSGTIINDSIDPEKNTIRKKYIKELMNQELETIQELLERDEETILNIEPADNYLTKQFRRKASQLSKYTSLKSEDFQHGGEEKSEQSETEEDRFVSTLTQKFRTDSEIKRFEKPRRKIKKGTFENFSFTELKQPILKTFYYGIKMGTIHQAAKRFSSQSRNRQNICMPIAAYCLTILKHPDQWTEADVDEVLNAGDSLFLECIESKHWHNANFEFNLNDLRKYCKIGSKKIRFVVGGPEISGMMRSDDRKVYNITKAISIFFERYKSGILQTEDFNIAIWKDKSYYFFDALPRTIELISHTEGAACLANFYDTTAIVSVLLDRSNLENVPFVIYSLKASKILKRDADEVDSVGDVPEADNFQVLNEEKAVALGSFDLADNCFGFSRNKQALTIAAVALVYSKISPPSSWHRTTIDKIMTIGNQLFLECSDNIDNLAEVNIDNLPAMFTIGPYLVEICIVPNRFVDIMFKKTTCNLVEKLEIFFEKNSNSILQIDTSALAVWKQRDIYHCFDPYSRSNEGLKCRNGVACVSMHSTLNSLISLIYTNFNNKNAIFYLHALKICKIHRDPAENLWFSKCLMMNDYSIEAFKAIKMKKGKRKAVNKSITVDAGSHAVDDSEDLEKSILEVGSDVRSLETGDLPAVCKSAPKYIPKLKTLPEDFVADLDSPSLSDTQIELSSTFVSPEQDNEIDFMDFDNYDLTEEEKEAQQRGENEETREEQESINIRSVSLNKLSLDEQEGIDIEDGGEEDWFMVASNFTQIGSHSLQNKTSQEINTEIPLLEIPKAELPPMTRNITHQVVQKFEPNYGLGLTTELNITMSEELKKETNFINLPDDSQIILGTQNISQYGSELEIMSPFVCIMAVTVSKKYAIASWSKEVIDYVLKCGSELFNSAHLRYDQSYKLEIPKVSLGSTDYSIKVDYVLDSVINHKTVSSSITNILFRQCNTGILVTPTYSCALIYKNNLFYLFDGFGSNEVGFGTGLENSGVACLARFKDINSVAARIIHNKLKREQDQDIEYNRFVLSSCYVKQLTQHKNKYKIEDIEQAEDEIDEEVEYVEAVIKKHNDRKSCKVGYCWIDNVQKIQGTKVVQSRTKNSELLNEDYFVCLCACLQLLDKPLKRWDAECIDSIIDQGLSIYGYANNLDVCSPKMIKNIQIGNYVFDVITNKVKFFTYQEKKTLKTAIEKMFAKKHQYFILQFPNRCFAINFNNDDNSYNLFDPNDQIGSASWTRYPKLGQLLRRLKQNLQRESESYNFHSFEILSIRKAPKQTIVNNRTKNYKVIKKNRPELLDGPLYEELQWLNVDPIPWSFRTNKNRIEKIYDWYEDCPGDLYSLFGSISPLDDRFPKKTKGKQALGNLVVAIGMLQIYELHEWNVPIIDSILINGDKFFRKCITNISTKNYEIAFEDIKDECEIFPYTFQVRFSPVVDGTLFLVRAKQFNLFKALRMFFENYERRFGVICVKKNEKDNRIYAFGKTKDSEYFLYDCETLGFPMFVEKDSGVPYVLRSTTFNRLLYVMCLTLRGGDFFIFEVNLSKLKSVM